MRHARFIGVDGGKSAVRVCAVDDSGAIMWQGDGPGFTYGTEAAADAESIVASILDAVRAAGASPNEAGPVRLCAGLTGLPGGVEERASLERALASTFAAEVILVDDAVAAHAGALTGSPGTVVAAGTGTVVLAVGADGRWARRDGWGPIVGDRGSAYDIGVQALRAAAASLDGSGSRTSLEQGVFAALGGTDLTALQRLYRAPDRVALVAGLARVVAEHADQADDTARAICERSGADLAATAVAAAGGVGFPPGSPVSYSGRLLAGAPVVARAFREKTEAAGLRWTEPSGDALAGAVLLARAGATGIHADLVARQGSAA
jgi:N-acetylglucosamine kinase-like BadF-type ATPase